MEARKYHKFVDTEIVFREFPDEITLAVNISNCPCHCPGCHSQELAGDIGEELTEERLDELITRNRGITCVGFMGGDSNSREIIELAKYVREKYPKLHRGWYSGRTIFPLNHGVFDYIKLGPYIEEKGGLDKKTTNQRMYMKVSGNDKNASFADITEKAFWAPKPWDPDYFEYLENKEKENE